MSIFGNDFCFSNVKKEKAKLLPDGWIWEKYNDGSGCLKAPDGKEYMLYDLNTKEYQFTREASYDFLPVAPLFGDGFDPKNFNPFEYMEKEIKRKLIKTNIMDKRLEILDKIKKYQDVDKSVPENFNYDDFGFYLGIKNVKNDIPVEDLGRLMKICYMNNTNYLNPMYLAEELTRAVYVKEYLSLDDLEKARSDDIFNILQEDKLYLLSNFSSKNINENEKGVLIY